MNGPPRRLWIPAVAAVAIAALWLTRPPETGYPDQPMPFPGPTPESPEPETAPPAGVVQPPEEASGTDAAPLWRAIDEASVNPLPEFPAHWSADGRRLVSVAGAVAASRDWRVGGRLTLPLPQLGETYEPIVSAIDDGPGGSRAAIARMTGGDGRPLRSVVTAGPGNVFAWVETPQGAYELFADDELGWLLPTTSMTANMDSGRRDYLLPGEYPGAGALFPSAGVAVQDR